MKKNKVLRKVAVVLAVFCLMILFTGCEPRQETVVVEETSWEYVIKIEKEVLCQESAWSLPEDATLLEEKQEVYKEKLDDEGKVIGYEYRTKYYYEIMRWKYERSVITNGTGFFEKMKELILSKKTTISTVKIKMAKL